MLRCCRQSSCLRAAMAMWAPPSTATLMAAPAEVCTPPPHASQNRVCCRHAGSPHACGYATSGLQKWRSHSSQHSWSQTQTCCQHQLDCRWRSHRLHPAAGPVSLRLSGAASTPAKRKAPATPSGGGGKRGSIGGKRAAGGRKEQQPHGRTQPSIRCGRAQAAALPGIRACSCEPLWTPVHNATCRWSCCSTVAWLRLG
jgi:hypothetical protein